MHDVIVIGGGVIGLAIAREVAGRMSVLLLERGPVGMAASWAAAGMLSPQSEAEDAGPFFRLSMASLRMYRAFVSELREETGVDAKYSDEGLLVLASSDESFRLLRRRHEWQKQAGLRVELLSEEEVMAREPDITLKLEGGLFFPDDHHVAPRPLVEALRQSCFQRGVEIRTGMMAESIVRDSSGVCGVRAGDQVFRASHVVLAAGVWSSQIRGLDPDLPLRPRKGQILSLRMPGRTFHHTVRWEHSYLVPRKDGELIVGATDEDAGYDQTLTPAGVGGLLASAQRISSRVSSYPILEAWAGLRPSTPDGLPILGESGVPRLYYAAGHYRNGILLAPITAKIFREVLCSDKLSESLDAFSPFRFCQKHV